MNNNNTANRSNKNSLPIKPLCSLLGLCIAGLAFSLQAAVPAKHWKGGISRTGTLWSVAANWVENAAPTGGEELVFPISASTFTITNDIVDLRPRKLTFEGANYTLRGNPITLSAGIWANQPSQASVIYLEITNSAPQTYSCPNTAAWLSVLGDVHLGANTLTVNSEGKVYLVGSVSGSGGLIKNGSGTNRLTGSIGNTYTGTTKVNAGVLDLDKSSGLAIAGPLVVGDGTNGGAVLQSYRDNLISGSVTINDGAVWFMNNHSDGIGSLTIKGGQILTGTGHLVLGANFTNLMSTATSGFIGNLFLGGTTRDFNIAAGSTMIIVGTIADFGSSCGITKTGGGMLRLYNCTNTYSGLTTVKEGTLEVEGPYGLGSSATGTVLSGGRLILEGAVIANEWLTNNASGSSLEVVNSLDSTVSDWAGNIVLNADLNVVVSAGQTLYLDGIISGAGGFTKSQTGAMVLRGSGNTYTGTTTVRDAGLELQKSVGDAVSGPLVIGPGSAPFVLLKASNQIGNVPVTVNSGGILDLSIANNEQIGALTLNGGYVTTGTGTLTLGGDLKATGPTGPFVNDIYGNLSLGSATRTFNTPGANDVLSIRAKISGLSSVGITKTGYGTVRLKGANNYSGLTTISEGLVMVANNEALGTFGSGTRLSGGNLQLEGITLAYEVIQNDSPNSTLVASAGVISRSSVEIVLNADLNIQVLSGGTLDISGTIDGSRGIVKSGPGTLIFSGTPANTYTGVTRVNEGTLVLTKLMTDSSIHGPLVIGDGLGGANADVVRFDRYNQQIADTVPVLIAASGRLDLNGRVENLGSLAGTGNVALGLGGSLITGGDNTSTVFDGVISGDGGVRKLGTGTMTLNGNNTYTLSTVIENGTLLVNGSQPQSLIYMQGNPVTRTLGGSGTVGAVTGTDGGTLSPGNPAGVLTTFDLSLNSAWTLAIELNGSTPGAGYDQINTVGVINLGNAKLRISLGFASTVGDTFTIINNDSNDPIIGTFNGLPEGATLSIGGCQFKISYTAGTGNDVVLTQLTEAPPALSIQRISTTQAMLSWPTNLSDVTLMSNTNLAHNVWLPVSTPPVIIGTNNVVTLNTTEPHMFFRLVPR